MISDHDRVVRHVGASKVEDGVVDGSAFWVRAEDVNGLSVNWLEYFGTQNQFEALAEIRNAFAAKKRKIGAQSRFAVLGVGATRAHVLAEEHVALNFRHVPEELDPSHSGIEGYGPEDHIVADLIAQTVMDLLPGKG